MSRPIRSRLSWLLLVAVASAAAGAPLPAQSPAHDEVRATVDRLFAGMRAGDSTVVRSVFHHEARLQTTVVRDGQAMLQTDSVDDFVRAVGTPHAEIWDEQIGEVEIRVDEPIATAWMTYRFFVGERFSHCGVNSAQLVRDPTSWRIVQLMDTRRPTCSP